MRAKPTQARRSKLAEPTGRVKQHAKLWRLVTNAVMDDIARGKLQGVSDSRSRLPGSDRPTQINLSNLDLIAL